MLVLEVLDVDDVLVLDVEEVLVVEELVVEDVVGTVYEFRHPIVLVSIVEGRTSEYHVTP